MSWGDRDPSISALGGHSQGRTKSRSFQNTAQRSTTPRTPDAPVHGADTCSGGMLATQPPEGRPCRREPPGLFYPDAWMSRMAFRLTAVTGATIALVLAACGRAAEPPGAETQTGAPALEAQGPVATSLRSWPVSFGEAIFSAVGPILRLGGDPPVDASFEEKAQFLSRLEVPVPGAVLEGSLLVPSLKEEWGLDLFDVEWDLGAKGAHVIGFRDGFEFEPLKARFRKCGFEENTSGDVTVYTHPFDPSDPCLFDELGLGPPPFIVNTTLFEDEGIALMATNRGLLDAMLRAKAKEIPSFAGTEGYAALVPHISGSHAAALGSSRLSCDFRSQASDVPPEYRGDRYAALAMAMTYRQPLSGRIVFSYANPEEARSDLDTRESALREAVSPTTSTPYRDMFRLEAARVEGSTAIFDVTPLQPSGDLLSMVFAGDFGFATC